MMGKVCTEKRKEGDQHTWTEHSPTQMEAGRGPSTHQHKWRLEGDRALTSTDGDKKGTENSPAQMETGDRKGTEHSPAQMVT